MTTVRRALIGVVAALLVPACNIDPTVAPAKGDFALLDPADGAIGVSGTPTFNWQESFSVETPTYTIQVATDPAFSSLVVNQSGLTTTSFTPAAVLTDGTVYYWQVLAVRTTGTVVSMDSPSSFTTFAATPAPFTMASPLNATPNVSVTPTFTWNTSVGAATYTLQVATDLAFTSLVINQTGLTMTSFVVTTPLNNSTPYFWQVMAVSTNSTTATGAPWTFTTAANNTVTLLSPPSGPTPALTPPVTFTWSATGSPASYNLQISTDPGFGSFVVNQNGTTTSATIAAPPLSATTTYYWRVQSLNSSNVVLATSSSFTFTTN
jgi:hypothetical protein